jgi:hypothetical protein
MKIDVEGFESEVVAGASTILKSESMLAIIVELGSLSERYGHNDEQFHALMTEYGYGAFAYDPFERSLAPLNGINKRASNTIYVRNPDSVVERVRTARKFRVHGREV